MNTGQRFPSAKTLLITLGEPTDLLQKLHVFSTRSTLAKPQEPMRSRRVMKDHLEDLGAKEIRDPNLASFTNAGAIDCRRTSTLRIGTSISLSAPNCLPNVCASSVLAARGDSWVLVVGVGGALCERVSEVALSGAGGR